MCRVLNLLGRSSIEHTSSRFQLDHTFSEVILMESSISNNFPKTAQALADKAKNTAKQAGTDFYSKADDFSSDRARSTVKHGLDAITAVASQARDGAADAYDTVLTYTKNNPLKALALAAASGALLYALIKALTPSRD
jgi:ElaB/YqjD/DUF883 family membrane-anchored ribosome-binding protein